MKSIKYLRWVWDYEGWAFLGFKLTEVPHPTSPERIEQEAFYLPEEWAGVIRWLSDHAGQACYYAPLLRKSDRREKGNAARHDLLWVDIDPDNEPDEALIQRLDPLVVSSGRGRHLYVPLDRPVSVAVWHAQQRALVKAIGGDAKIADNDFMRLPGSTNYRTGTKVTIKKAGRTWDPAGLRAIVRPVKTRNGDCITHDVITPQRVSKMPYRVRSVVRQWRQRYEYGQVDRSAAHLAVTRECLAAGLTPGQTMTILLDQEWCKWTGTALAKDIARVVANV